MKKSNNRPIGKMPIDAKTGKDARPKKRSISIEKVEELFWKWWKPDFKEMKEDGEKFIRSLKEHEK